MSKTSRALKSCCKAPRKGGGGQGGGGQGGGGAAGAEPTGGGQAGGDAAGGYAAGGYGSDTDSSTTTSSLATSLEVPVVPGIYGNQFELQVDVSRLPKMEDYLSQYQIDPNQVLRDIPSDTKSVTYYVQNPGTSAGHAVDLVVSGHVAGVRS